MIEETRWLPPGDSVSRTYRNSSTAKAVANRSEWPLSRLAHFHFSISYNSHQRPPSSFTTTPLIGNSTLAMSTEDSGVHAAIAPFSSSQSLQPCAAPAADIR